MGTVVEEQLANVQPPRRGECFALTVDSTARPYDITALAFGGITPEAAHARRLETFVTLRAVTNDVWFYFSKTTASDLDNTAAIAAGGALAYATPHAFVIPAGTETRVRLDRSTDLFLIVKAASTSGILLFRASSHPGGS
jgi:hypothetical protein